MLLPVDNGRILGTGISNKTWPSASSTYAILWCLIARFIVGFSRDRPGVKLLWALIATLLNIEYRMGVSAVPCILPSSVDSPALWQYVPSVIPSQVLTLRFMLSLTSDRALTLSIFWNMPAFLTNMLEFCRKIQSKQLFSSYWVIAIVLLL